MEVEYQLTAEDLYSYQWRAAYTSPKNRRARRRAYLYLMLPFLVIGLLPTIGPGGFVIARINLLFLVMVLPLLAGGPPSSRVPEGRGVPQHGHAPFPSPVAFVKWRPWEACGKVPHLSRKTR